MKEYTKKEVSEQMGVSYTTVSNWIKKGIIKAETRYKGIRLVTFISEKELNSLKNKYLNK